MLEDLSESANFHNVRHSQPRRIRAAAFNSGAQHLNESAWFSIRQGTKQYCVYDAENCCRGSDAQRERQHGHCGEARVLQQLAEGEFQIIHGSLIALKGVEALHRQTRRKSSGNRRRLSMSSGMSETFSTILKARSGDTLPFVPA